MQRKNFAFRFEWIEAIASYDTFVRLEIIEATVMYAQTGQLPEMSFQAKLGFETYILPDFERRRKAAEYRARAKARRQAQAAERERKNTDAVPGISNARNEVYLDKTSEFHNFERNKPNQSYLKNGLNHHAAEIP